MTNVPAATGPIFQITLQGRVTVASATELKEELSQALDSRREISVSLAGAVSLDITAMQLLWAASRDSRAAGRAFTLQGPVSPQLLAIFEEAGVPGASLFEGKW